MKRKILGWIMVLFPVGCLLSAMICGLGLFGTLFVLGGCCVVFGGVCCIIRGLELLD
jgi:hypothetical protein